MSNCFSNKLVLLMQKHNKKRFAEIIYNEAKEFYNELILKRRKDKLNFIANRTSLSINYTDDDFNNDKIIFYFNKFWDTYEKIIVLKSMDVEEYAILIKGVYCDIPKHFKNNNKIIAYIVGVDKNKNKMQTNKVVISVERK